MRRAVLLLIGCSWSLLAANARADAYDAALSQAIGLKETAIQSNAPSDWEAALRAMRAVESIRTTRETRYEIGTIAAHLRADDLAFEAFEDALALGLDGPARKTAQTFLDDHRTTIARLRIRGPAGGRVVVLQRERAVLPSDKPVVVFAGPVEVSLLGGTATRRVTVAPGAIVDVDFTAPAPERPVARAVPEVAEPPGGSTRPWTWSLVVAGGSVAGASLATVILASLSIPAHRSTIVALCPKEKLDGDRCLAAPEDRRDTLASERSALLTWSAVRTGAFVGLGVGAALAMIGVVRLSTTPATAAWSPVVQTAGNGVYVGLRGAF